MHTHSFLFHPFACHLLSMKSEKQTKKRKNQNTIDEKKNDKQNKLICKKHECNNNVKAKNYFFFNLITWQYFFELL